MAILAADCHRYSFRYDHNGIYNVRELLPLQLLLLCFDELYRTLYIKFHLLNACH